MRLHEVRVSSTFVYLIQEAGGCDLYQFLGQAARHHALSPLVIAAIAEGLSAGVAAMHAHGWCHRDIKPENVLLSDNTTGAQIKIVDLGLSRFHDERKLMRTICGTHKYLAPELIKCDRGQAQGYDKTIDMWGVGLLAYIMLFGFNPFARSAQTETHNAILACTWAFPDGYTVSKEAMDFVAVRIARLYLGGHYGKRKLVNLIQNVEPCFAPWVSHSTHIHDCLSLLLEFLLHRMDRLIHLVTQILRTGL